jgi:MFS family permease
LTAGIFISTVLGGVIGDYLAAKYGRQWPVVFAGFSVCLRTFWLWSVIVREKESSESWMLLLGLTSYLHVSTTTTMLLNANLPELRGTVAGIGASLEDVSRAVGPALLGGLLEMAKRWGGGMGDEERQRRIIGGTAVVLWMFVGIAIMIVGIKKVEIEERQIKEILEAEAKAAIIEEEKKLSLIELDNTINNVLKNSGLLKLH